MFIQIFRTFESKNVHFFVIGLLIAASYNICSKWNVWHFIDIIQASYQNILINMKKKWK